MPFFLPFIASYYVSACLFVPPSSTKVDPSTHYIRETIPSGQGKNCLSGQQIARDSSREYIQLDADDDHFTNRPKPREKIKAHEKHQDLSVGKKTSSLLSVILEIVFVDGPSRTHDNVKHPAASKDTSSSSHTIILLNRLGSGTVDQPARVDAIILVIALGAQKF